MSSVYSKYYQVAGITIKIKSDFPMGHQTFHPKFKDFEIEKKTDCDVKIHHHFSTTSFRKEILTKENMVHKQFSWEIYRDNADWYYKFIPSTPTDPKRTVYAAFSENHSIGNIYTDDIDEKAYSTGRFESLMLFNTDKALLSKLMSDRDGGLLHCNGIETAEGCLLLTGPSGAGKTTLSTILSNNGYGFIGDDVMIISRQNNAFHAHGLWCHGSQPVTVPGSFPLKAIFFLEHHTGNTITLLSSSQDRVYPLLSAFVKPVLSKAGWKQSFDFLESVIRSVPCYRVQFNLSGDIVNSIKKIWRPSK